MTNLSIRVFLPAGFRLADGRTLRTGLHLVLISRLEPYYASVEMVRVLSGGWLENLHSDIPVALAIWLKSVEADTMTYQKPVEPAEGETGPSAERYHRFIFGRSQYVAYSAAADMVTRMLDVTSGRGAKRLGNFEISQPRNQDAPGREILDQLRKEAEAWKIVVQSGGRIGKAGPIPFTRAVRARETTPPASTRLWLVTGMGANRTGGVYFGSEYQLRKFYSPFFYSWYRSQGASGYIPAPWSVPLPLQMVSP